MQTSVSLTEDRATIDILAEVRSNDNFRRVVETGEH